jgi:tellurite resistance protein
VTLSSSQPSPFGRIIACDEPESINQKEVLVKKKLALFGILMGAVAACVFVAKRRGASIPAEERGLLRKEKRQAMFEKMQEGFEAMPEDFPPMAMYNNLDTVRQNSERILEILESEDARDKKVVAAAN